MPWDQVMHKWKSGQLHSGSPEGPKVKSQKQAVAIMLSEKRAAGEGKKEYQSVKKHNKGGSVEPSEKAAISQNILETLANPIGRHGLKKGGLVEDKGYGWRRWGQGSRHPHG